jgi:hypothetical protein
MLKKVLGTAAGLGVILIVGLVWAWPKMLNTAMTIADQRPEATTTTAQMPACSTPAAVSKGERDHFLDGKFDEIDSVKLLAAPVRDRLSPMADPGEEFQATDVIRNDHLPWTRLIFAGKSANRVFVYYEHGGIGLYQVLEVIDAHTGCTMWSGSGWTKAKSADDLRVALKEGVFLARSSR